MKARTEGHIISRSVRGLAAAIALAGAGSIFAGDVPKLINYQGFLTNAAGGALKPDGTYKVKFAIYAADTTSEGEAVIWGSSYDIPVVDGRFNVILGSNGGTPVAGASVNDIGFAFGEENRFIEMTVVSGPELTVPIRLQPRQQILSTPFALNASFALHGVPPGTVVPFAGSSAPEGWLLCDGGEVSSSRYPRLAVVLQNTYGTASAGMVRLPDLRGRTAIGAGSAPSLTARSLGQTLGEEKHTLTVAEMPSHSHGVNDPGHSHRQTVSSFIGGSYYATNQSSSRYQLINGNSPASEHVGTGISIAGNGGDTPHNVMQPSIVLQYLIKY